VTTLSRNRKIRWRLSGACLGEALTGTASGSMGAADIKTLVARNKGRCGRKAPSRRGNCWTGMNRESEKLIRKVTPWLRW